MPLVYIGNGDKYISVYRQGDTADPRRLMVDVNGKYTENIGNVFQAKSTDKDTGKELGSDDWINISLTYNESEDKVSIDLSVNGKRNSNNEINEHFDVDVSTYGLNFDNADIIIGGDVVNSNKDLPYSGVQLTTFCVFSKALTEDEIKTLNENKNISDYDTMKSIEGLTAFYDFGDADSSNKLGNRVTEGSDSLIFI